MRCQSVKVSNSFSAEIAQVLQGLNTNKTKTLTCQSFFALQEHELLCIQLELIIYSSVSWHSNVGDYYKKR